MSQASHLDTSNHASNDARGHGQDPHQGSLELGDASGPARAHRAQSRVALADLWNAILSDSLTVSDASLRIREELDATDALGAALDRLALAWKAARQRSTTAPGHLRACRRDLCTLLIDVPGSEELAERLVAEFERRALDPRDELCSGPAFARFSSRCRIAQGLVEQHRHPSAAADESPTVDPDRRSGAQAPPSYVDIRAFVEAIRGMNHFAGRRIADLEYECGLLSVANSLPRADAQLLRRRFGLAAMTLRTLDDIGELYSLSHERIAQLRERGLRRLRKELRADISAKRERS